MLLATATGKEISLTVEGNGKDRCPKVGGPGTEKLDAGLTEK